jgi:hypothetical protein
VTDPLQPPPTDPPPSPDPIVVTRMAGGMSFIVNGARFEPTGDSRVVVLLDLDALDLIESIADALGVKVLIEGEPR